MLRIAEGVDAVVHLAASATGLPDVGTETFRFNAVGTYVRLEVCRDCKSNGLFALPASTPLAPSIGE